MAFRFQSLAPALIALALPAQIAAQPPAPAPGAAPRISLEQRTLLRCAAAFALVAHDQAAGDPNAQQWPDLRQRGREFFVRASAELMDEAGLTRPQIAALMEDAAHDFRDSDTLDRAMPPCLLTLEASGL